jgi:hypothetical protein
LQARQAAGGEAFAPLADRVAIAVQFGGDGLVAGPIGGGSAEDEPATESKGLRRGARTNQGFQVVAGLGRQEDAGAKRTGHGGPPCRANKTSGRQRSIIRDLGTPVQTLAANL